MSEQAKTEPSCGGYDSGVPWYPLRKWWQSSRLFNQDLGLPPFLEPRDPRWMDVDQLQRSLAACSWPGYIPAPLFVPYISGSMHHPGQISKEQYKWRVSLEVAHFFPSEIFLSVIDGFLEVRGRHEERPDEHGFIARCFTRKYRLPAEIDATKIVSTLSVDGILTVEAPVSETSVPAAIIIPIKVELEVTGEKQEKEEAPDTEPDSSRAPEDDVEESPPEVRGDEAQSGGATAGLQQHEERRGQEEETHEEPAGESHPTAPVDGEGPESLQDSSEQREAQESPDTDMSKQPEHKEPAVDGEIQVMAGSGEAAEEITHPEEPELGKGPPSEVPSQELEGPDIKQGHTE
ncbi:heat shock protein beta-1 [Centropristis striata]|uniref:heat shock protein beta-1 n=1 Tax=Centropristis striata TaxID=184440 RepID=UPI0027E063CF|nr:heat shock protein beta-1 [Centropristis striata]